MSPRTEREAAMDDMGDYASRFAPIRMAPAHAAPRFVGSPTLAHSSPAVVEALNDAVDESIKIELKLGLATVCVEYILVAGCPLIQGATVNGEWTDADCFARHVTAGWRRDIERVREVQHG